MPDASTAFEIYEHHDSAMRAGIEARFLAGQSATEIAQRAGVTVGAIAFYSAVFFDVEGRLDARDFILNHVVSASRRRRGADAARDAAWKYVGYMGGPDLLEAIMYGAPPAEGQISQRDLARHLAESAEVLARQGVVDKVTSSVPQDVQLARQLQSLCGTTGITNNEEKVQLDAYEENVAKMLELMPWRVCRRNITDGETPDKIRELEKNGVILRAHELSLYGMTGALPNIEVLSTAEFPEPIKKKNEESDRK
jgi:hypothetical protein